MRRGWRRMPHIPCSTRPNGIGGCSSTARRSASDPISLRLRRVTCDRRRRQSMRKSIWLIGVLVLVAGSARAELRAGAAKVSITPDPKAMAYTLGGYGAKERFENKATGIHDTCYARALAISNGETKCVMVSLDLCFLPANVKEMV